MTRQAAKTVWITGAGKGIGRALALRMAQDGARVAASARTASDLDDLAVEAGNLPGRIVPFPLDIVDREAVRATVAEIEAQIGPIDLAILNAGTHTPIWLKDFSAEKVQHLIDVNLMGTVNCLDPLMHTMTARGSGHVAVVSSVAGYCGLPSASAYGASKAGLINLCEALQPELDMAGVRLTLINPGFVDTPLTKKNDFDMPFLVSQDDAVRAIMRGLDRSRFEIVFPLPMALTMRFLRALPYRLFFALTKRMVRK
ncbi:MAG: SDR family NAD(P)-dependent oxidoreductase [Pseudomonadota bacterium]